MYKIKYMTSKYLRFMPSNMIFQSVSCPECFSAMFTVIGESRHMYLNMPFHASFVSHSLLTNCAFKVSIFLQNKFPVNLLNIDIHMITCTFQLGGIFVFNNPRSTFFLWFIGEALVFYII